MANNSLSKLPWYAQIGIFVAISLVLVGLFWYFVESPKQITLQAQAKELSEIRARVTQGQTMARQLPQFRAEVQALELRLNSLKAILPDERDAGDLLRRVQTLAVQSNLQIRNFRPMAIVTHEMHAEWPIQLQLEGNYHNLGKFLDQVSKFPRIINVGNMTLAARPEPSANASMNMGVTATTFVFVEPPPAPPEGAGKGKKTTKKAPAKAPAKK